MDHITFNALDVFQTLPRAARHDDHRDHHPAGALVSPGIVGYGVYPMICKTWSGARGPQSAQSCPALHAREKASGPPSSHSPSRANSHELSHTTNGVGEVDGLGVVGRLVGVREGERLGRDVDGARLGESVGVGTHDVTPDAVLVHEHHFLFDWHADMRCSIVPL